VAPSTELRRWYAHDPAKFAEFRRRYQAELAEPPASDAWQELRDLAAEHRLVLVTATRTWRTARPPYWLICSVDGSERQPPLPGRLADRVSAVETAINRATRG
jgi:hypothetical protein